MNRGGHAVFAAAWFPIAWEQFDSVGEPTDPASERTSSFFGPLLALACLFGPCGRDQRCTTLGGDDAEFRLPRDPTFFDGSGETAAYRSGLLIGDPLPFIQRPGKAKRGGRDERALQGRSLKCLAFVACRSTGPCDRTSIGCGPSAAEDCASAGICRI